MNQTATTLLTELQAPLAPGPSTAVKTNGCQLLLLDDSAIALNVMSAILRRVPGVLLTVESSPHRALEILRHDPGNFDLVLTDIRMPVMNGIEFAARVKELRPELPILAVTTAPLVVSGNPDFSAILPKPFSSEELITGVREILRALAPDQPATPSSLSSLNSRGTQPLLQPI